MSAARTPLRVLILGTLVIAPAAQESAAVFDAPVVVLPVDSAPFQKLFDFDGDGDLDAVGFKTTENPVDEVTVQVWQNDGYGRYAPVYTDVADPPPLTSDTNPLGLVVADFDGDGLDDFALSGHMQTWKYLATPTGTFAKTVLGGGKGYVAAADFDGDGGADIAYHDFETTYTLWSDGSWTNTIAPYGPNWMRLIVAETDGDSLPDLVGVATFGLVVFRYEGKTLVQEPTIYVGQGTWLADAADIDQDGDEDVVYFGATQYEVLRRTGPTSWVKEAALTGGPAEYLADIDGDGDPDGVCCGGGGGRPPGPGTYPTLHFASKFEIAMNQGGGAFAPAFEMEGLGSKSLAGAADVDGDGDVDLVAGRCVYFARGGGPTPAPASKLSVSPALAFADQFTDWDLDGDPDITLYVGANPWRNLGDGSFGSWPNWPWNVNPPGTTTSGPQIIGDFDGDGDADVIMPQYQQQTFAPPLFLHMYLWKNAAGAGFVPFGPAAPAGLNFKVGQYAYSPESALVRDLDGDGDLDVAMRSYEPSTAKQSWLYLNDGTGFFTPAESWLGERVEAVADFDHDGRPDLLVSTWIPWALQLRWGTGAGPGAMFAPAAAVFPGIVLQQDQDPIEVRDFNGDGFADVAAVNSDHSVWIFVNPVPSGAGPSWIETHPIADVLDGSTSWIHGRDVDGDGFEDLVVGYAASAPNARTIYRFQPSAAGAVLTPHSFQPGVTQVINGLYPADFDGDGDVDYGGQVIYRNASFHGPDAGFRQQYGANNAGSGGFAPILGASGPFRVGQRVEIRLRGAAPGSTTFLDVAPAKAAYVGFPTPESSCWIDVFSPALVKFAAPSGGLPGLPGTGGYTVPVNVSASLVGPQFELQAFVIDFGAPGYVTASNGLSLRFGP